MKSYKIVKNGKKYIVDANNQVEALQKLHKGLKVLDDKSMGTYGGYKIFNNEQDHYFYVLTPNKNKVQFSTWQEAYNAIKSNSVKDANVTGSMSFQKIREIGDKLISKYGKVITVENLIDGQYDLDPIDMDNLWDYLNKKGAKIKDATMKDSEYTFKLAKRKNDYDEFVVRAFKNGRYDEGATYYTDDWEDAVGTLKAMSKQYGLSVKQKGSSYTADALINDAYMEVATMTPDDDIYYAKKHMLTGKVVGHSGQDTLIRFEGTRENLKNFKNAGFFMYDPDAIIKDSKPIKDESFENAMKRWGFIGSLDDDYKKGTTYIDLDNNGVYDKARLIGYFTNMTDLTQMLKRIGAIQDSKPIKDIGLATKRLIEADLRDDGFTPGEDFYWRGNIIEFNSSYAATRASKIIPQHYIIWNKGKTIAIQDSKPIKDSKFQVTYQKADKTGPYLSIMLTANSREDAENKFNKKYSKNSNYKVLGARQLTESEVEENANKGMISLDKKAVKDTVESDRLSNKKCKGK